MSLAQFILAHGARSGLLAAAAAALVAPASARAETRASVDVSVGETAASNPYLLDGADTEAAGANITVDPSIFFEDEDTSLQLDGSLGWERFFGRYGSDASVAVAASGEHRIDERTTLSAEAGFRSSESPARRFLGSPGLEELEPGEFPDGTLIDPTLGGLGGRTSRLDVSTAVTHLAGPNSLFTASAGLGLTRVESEFGQDYRDSTVAAAYARQLTARTSLSTSVNAGYADYLDASAGDGWYLTALVGAEHQFTEALYASAQLGASLSAAESFAGGRDTSVSWAGNLDVCDKREVTTLCITGTRSAAPTSRGGLTTVSSIGLNYARSLGTAASVSASATYARSSRLQGFVMPSGSSRSELTSISGTYRHRLGERLSAFVTPSFTSIADDASGSRENYQLLLGVSYHLGTTR